MIQLFKDPSYDFVGKRRWAYLASTIFILVGLASIGMKGGLRYGIDFAGGTPVQLRFEESTSIERIRSALDRLGLGESIIQEFGDPREFVLRLPVAESSPAAVAGQVQEALGKDSSLARATVRRVEFVGPQVGRDLQLQALQAVGWSIVGILVYIAIRFDLKGGVASIVAIVHDVLVCLGAMSLTDREMSLAVLAREDACRHRPATVPGTVPRSGSDGSRVCSCWVSPVLPPGSRWDRRYRHGQQWLRPKRSCFAIHAVARERI